MDKIAIGKLMKSRRKSLDRSQFDVCNGICDVSSYSRIERGLVDSSADILIYLFERLGLSTEILNDSINEQDDRIRQVIREASHENAHGDQKHALSLLETISEEYENFSQANKQRYDTVDTMIAYEEGVITNEERLTNMEKALRMTVPNYGIDNLPPLLTNTESLILRYIANAYAVLESYDIAIKVYYYLKSRENKKSDRYAASKNLVHICYNLSKCLGQVGRYDECIKVAKEGMCCCKYVSNISMLPSCMYNCVWSLVLRNNDGDREEAKRLIDKISELNTPMTWNGDGLKNGINDILNTYINHISSSSVSSIG